jgi:hypothetical protein
MVAPYDDGTEVVFNGVKLTEAQVVSLRWAVSVSLYQLCTDEKFMAMPMSDDYRGRLFEIDNQFRVGTLVNTDRQA